jgi:hypothetical protein
MSTKNNIRKALKSIMSESEANACDIRKGYHYNGSTEESGWYYRPFNREPVTLGKNESEALETIEQIKESRRL